MNILNMIISRPAKKAKLFKINFNKPWWNIFIQQKVNLFVVTFYIIIDDSLHTLLPLALGWVIGQANINYLVILILAYLLVEIIGWFTYYPFLTRLYTQTFDSFRFSAFKALLAIDPIYHIQRPSGAIVGKIQRTNNAFLEFTTTMFSDMVPFVVEICALIISMFLFNITLGFIVSFFIFFITGAFSFIIIKYTSNLEKVTNKQDDIVQQQNLESLSQLQFIRSTFATDKVKFNLRKAHLDVMKNQTILWMSYGIIKGIFVFLYFITLGSLAYYLIYLVKTDIINSTIAVSLLLTYLRGTKRIFKIDKHLKTVIKSYRLIQDFYSFIRVFGQQTYPIFEEDESQKIEIVQKDDTDIRLSNITFAYPNHQPILKNNSLHLKILKKYKNKLFGLIGPSGIGKTTILSILGGQLRPKEGVVLINDINIYKVNDSIRRQLIAIQGQVATSLRGSLRYNILFGLPDNHGYSDEKLIDILNAVGLWKLFANKEGLNTFIGETGLNLSGGQRQRLNFANLYLRARFFKPLLILIDEPTSSLDEISERAITEMIEELAAESVTFVIAHRLKTLEDAYEILDFSLMKPGSTLEFYKPEELKKISDYYRNLLDNMIRLED